MIFMKKYIIEFRMLSILHYCVQCTFIVGFFSQIHNNLQRIPVQKCHAFDKQYSGPLSAPQAGFTTPYPATTNNCPPQPHPVNNGIAPYPIDGTNPATMGIAQPPRIRQQLHNHGLVK
jgi:hypothetical protein